MDDVLIVGKLDDGELRKAIDSLVNDVANKSTQMALTFEQAMDKMTNAMKNFAISQNVSVDLMQEAWKKMSQSFDAMVQAQSSGSSGGGGNSGRKQYDDDTIGALREQVRLQKQVVDEQRRGTAEAQEQVNKHRELQRQLKEETTARRSLADVMKMDESSVDAIARKMKALKSVSIDTKSVSQVNKLGNEYQRLSRLQAELLGKNIQLTHSNNYLAQSFGYIRNRIVYALTLGAVTSFVKQVYEIRGQYELLERSLGVLINSFERGSKIFQELNAMSIESPFTLMELAGAAKQLTAYNFSAKEVVDTTRRLADLSAALGVPMERLVYNLGQIRAQTVLTARDARDFANAGLPVVKLLSDYYTELEGKVVSTGDVYDRMSKKMVSYTDVMTVLNKATDEGGKFFDFQAKQAETLRVQMANLTLAYNNMLNEIGKENQGLLSAPVKGLKVLFQNWESIARVIKNLGLSFIFLKATQLALLPVFGALNANFVSTARLATTLRGVVVSLGAAFKALFLNPWTWVFAGIFAFTDAIGVVKRAIKEVAELNQEIKKGASEASSSNIEYLMNKGNQATRDAAKEGKLTAEQGEKAWQSLEEQINTSAISANNILGELWQIEDVNERVAKGFDYVESIQKSQAALQDLKDYTIRVDQSGFGLDGLVDDLKDYKDLLDEATKNGIVNWDAIHISSEFKQFQSELDITAESITHFLDVHKIEDPKQVREILERIKMQIKMQNPEIKGELEQIFDFELDKRMSELTQGAVDENYSLWNTFMERLKHNASAAFQDITSDIYNENTKLSAEQQKAVDDNLKYFQDTMPLYYNAVKDMVADASKLKIQIGMTFSTQLLTDLQNQVNERIKKAPKVLDFGNASFLPNQKEDLPEWVKRQQDAIKGLQSDIKTYEKDNSEWAKQQIQDANTEITQRTNLLELFGQTAEVAKKTTTKRTSTEDVLGKALQKEVEIITNIQKKYKDYQKIGADAQTSITKATNEYARTLASTNATLNQYGIKTTKSGKELANMDLRDLRSYYQGLLAMAAGLGNAKGIEVLEKAISNINDEITKLDYKKITDGLNNELGKLKDEYELAIELDANPELGNMFTDMFGITPEMLSEMPHTVGQLVDKYQDEIDKQLKDNFNTPFDILKTDIDKWAKDTGVNPKSDLIKALSSTQNKAREMVKKTFLDTQKMIDDYISEYGDQQQQIEKIEKEKNNALLQLNSIYNTEALRQTKEYINAKEAIENAARIKSAKASFDALKKTTDYERFFNAIDTLTSKDALAIKAKIKQGIIQAFKDGGLTVSEFRREIKALESQFDKLTESSSLWTNYLSGGFDKLIQKAKETGQEIEAIGESISIKGTIDDKDKNFLQSMGSIFSNGNGGNMDFTSLMNKFGGNMKGLGDAVSQAGQGMQQGAGGFASAVAVIDTIIKNVHQTVQAIGSVIDELDSVRNEDSKISNAYWEGFKKFDNYAMSGWENLKSGNVAGAMGDTVNSIISVFNTFSNAKNEKINKQIKESERTVKDLENAYKNLSAAIDDSIGNAEIKARRAAVENKKLQLVELERQLQLEQSRSSKRRDEDRIKELQGQITDAKNEIKDLTAEITSTLLGNDIKSAAEDFVSTWVAAWRQGEDTMDALNKKFDGMIDNMIAKSVASYLVSKRLQRIFDLVDEMTSEKSEGGAEITMNELKRIKSLIGDKSIAEQINQDLTNLYGALDIAYGVDSETNKNLSALQQGIQGITEDTAGAIEAYMNGMSQQVYLQSGVLTQIRDAILGFELDVQLGVSSQMLLQLQQSYQVQQSIEQVLQNVLNPSGRAFVVELAS